MNIYRGENCALCADLYELTMMQGYYLSGNDVPAVFDMFFRKEPFGGGYAVFAGLEPLVRAITGFRFDEAALGYLAGLGLFQDRFLKYLAGFRFEGDLYAAEEGEIVFAREPLLRVHAALPAAQLVESIVLNTINYQTLIATKTARIADAAGGRMVVEFGLRRAHGIDGALSASRAAFIGGAASTSHVLAGAVFGIPVQGTMAHSWIMSFASEYEAFRRYARLYPGQTILLVDTYDTLKKGIPAAIRVFKRLKACGIRHFGIRLDSGDLEYLSKRSRAMLDGAGLKEAKIVASNELDEYAIAELMAKRAPIDIFGVGTKLVSAAGDPALSGVYKLVARRSKRTWRPSIKISDTPEKATNPHIKNVARLYGADGLMRGDLIYLEQDRERMERLLWRRRPVRLYHPEYVYRSVPVREYRHSRTLLSPVVRGGTIVRPFPALVEARENAVRRLKELHPTCRRLLNPHVYKVSLEKKLLDMKIKLMRGR